MTLITTPFDSSFRPALPRQADYVDAMVIGSMAETLALLALVMAASLLIWLLEDSDDDNSGGGLREPVLIPIPVRDQPRR